MRSVDLIRDRKEKCQQSVGILSGDPARRVGHITRKTLSQDDPELRVTIDHKSFKVLTENASGPLREVLMQNFFIFKGGRWCLIVFGGGNTTMVYFYDNIRAAGTNTSSIALQLIHLSKTAVTDIDRGVAYQFSVPRTILSSRALSHGES